MRYSLIVLTALCLLPLGAQAESLVSRLMPNMANPNCQTTETCSISISFSSIEKDVNTATTLMDTKTKEIEALVKQAGIEKFDMQSVNYSLSPYNSGYGNSQWQFSGSVSINVTPSDKGKDLLVLLTNKGYQGSLNVSAYRNGTCDQ